MKKTISYLKYTKKETILGPLFKMLEVVFELLVPLIVSSIIDEGINSPTGSDNSLIIQRCLLMLLLATLGLISAVTAQYFSAKAAVKLSTNLRKDLFEKIESLQYSELDELGTSTLITRMTSDVNTIQTGVNMVLRLLLRSPVVIIGAIIVAFTINTQSGFIFLCTVPTLFIIIFIILVLSIPLYKKVQLDLDKIVLRSRENLNGVRLIRAFNEQDDEIIAFEKENNLLFKEQLFVGRISNITNPLTYCMINIFVIILIYNGAIKVNDGILSQGNVVALYSLSSQILVEMIKFANLIITLSKAIASSSRVEKILSLKSSLIHEDTINGDEKYLFEVNNISFNYKKSSTNAINNISFKVKKGEKVGIIGGTGSGKTTLINVLNHFYDVNEGKIFYKGKNLNSYPLEKIHEEISLVPQKAKLFKGTIKSNLLWGNPDANEKMMLNAIKMAQGDDIIKKKKLGLDEVVEQDGRNFSGGQKQRLSIARALIKQSDVLILDDSSSALDYQTESKLRKEIASLKDKTVFIISQRTSSIAHCDQILVLDNGILVGKGKHDELLKNCSVYQEIYYSQYEKENL